MAKNYSEGFAVEILDDGTIAYGEVAHLLPIYAMSNRCCAGIDARIEQDDGQCLLDLGNVIEFVNRHYIVEDGLRVAVNLGAAAAVDNRSEYGTVPFAEGVVGRYGRYGPDVEIVAQ